MIHVLAIEFPPISHVIEWPSGPLGINKVVVLMWVSVALVFGIMYAGSRKKALVPKGVQNVAESAVDFVHNGIVLETIGPDGMKFAPFLFTLVHVHLRPQHLGHRPRRADAGERTHCTADVHGPAGVGHLPRRRHREAGPLGLLQERDVPAWRALAPLLPGVADRARAGPDRPAAVAGRSTLRQHARRPPPADELRRHHGVALEPLRCSSSSGRSHSAC